MSALGCAQRLLPQPSSSKHSLCLLCDRIVADLTDAPPGLRAFSSPARRSSGAALFPAIANVTRWWEVEHSSDGTVTISVECRLLTAVNGSVQEQTVSHPTPIMGWYDPSDAGAYLIINPLAPLAMPLEFDAASGQWAWRGALAPGADDDTEVFPVALYQNSTSDSFDLSPLALTVTPAFVNGAADPRFQLAALSAEYLNGLWAGYEGPHSDARAGKGGILIAFGLLLAVGFFFGTPLLRSR
jgi:hypothetical protein